jgi:hypothetical protein
MIVGVLSASRPKTKVNRRAPFAVFAPRAISRYEARSAAAELVGVDPEIFLSSTEYLPPFVKKSLSSVVENFLYTTALSPVSFPPSLTCQTDFPPSF